MTAAFEVETTIDAPAEAAFDLSLDMDAHIASMGTSKERAVAGVTSGQIGLDEEVTLRGTHFGIPFTMTSRVTELERPSRFVDLQVSGPFGSWHHEHAYRRTRGGTVMTDRIRFAAPFGPVGWLAERLFLTRYMRRLIRARGRWLKAEAERRARGAGGG